MKTLTLADWRDISTALKDETAILVLNDRGVFVARWSQPDFCENCADTWVVSDGKMYYPLRGDEPSYWMPLPSGRGERERGLISEDFTNGQVETR